MKHTKAQINTLNTDFTYKTRCLIHIVTQCYCSEKLLIKKSDILINIKGNFVEIKKWNPFNYGNYQEPCCSEWVYFCSDAGMETPKQSR